MTISQFVKTLNAYGSQKIPFLFLIDFEMQKPIVFKLSEIDPSQILYDINGFSNTTQPKTSLAEIVTIEKELIPLSEYKFKFNQVFNRLTYGDSYLTNLTVKSPIRLNHSLHDLFYKAQAKYKLWYKNEWLVFSPETFVRIEHDKIFSYPMKGTIDATVPGAREKILNDQKELAEHVTIVDLIRNDLSLVATQVKVTRFRYIERITTHKNDLLQVSSEIVGELASDYRLKLGDVLINILPAGSVSGAPKPKTLAIISEVENERRGYYTGVVGYFDGSRLDSGVMIRYIEQKDNKYYYRSGGGITAQSKVESEYQEVIDKIYVPVN